MVNTSTLNPTGLSLYNAYSSAVPFGNFISYTLTGGSTSSEIRPTITIELTEDLNQLKALQRSGLSGLCSVASTCYVRVDSTLIEDVSGNPVHVLTESPVRTKCRWTIGSLQTDTIQPNLANFSIDLTNDILSLTFDETIDYTSLRSEFISIQGAFNALTSIPLRLKHW